MRMEITKNTHGGAREGAGRKKVGDAVLAKISAGALLKLKSLAKSRGMVVGTYIEQLIKDL